MPLLNSFELLYKTRLAVDPAGENCRRDSPRRAVAYEGKQEEVVGAKGFEPSTSWSRTRRASQAALRPDECSATGAA